MGRAKAAGRGVLVACWLAAFAAAAWGAALAGSGGLGAPSTGPGVLAWWAWRDGGRVVACRYVTATGLAERQRAAGGRGGAGGVPCPLLHAGR